MILKLVIIPYCNLLSYLFSSILDDSRIKSKNGYIDLLSKNLSNTITRFYISKYINELYSKYNENTKFIIISSYYKILLDDICDAYNINSEYFHHLKLSSLNINLLARKILKEIDTHHRELDTLTHGAIKNFDTLQLNHTYSYNLNFIQHHFISKEYCEILPKGEFIIDAVDKDLSANEIEKIQKIKKTDIEYLAVKYKIEKSYDTYVY